jgi:hypothetical protein
MIPNNFIYNLEKRISDNILYEVDSSNIPIITTGSFITLFMNWDDNRLLALIRQFFLIPNGNNEFVDHTVESMTLFITED